MDIIQRAQRLATRAHRGQQRKYTGEPYIVHPAAVAATVASVTTDPDTIACAWLHDTVEDTTVTNAEIRLEFGTRIAALVAEVTNPSRPEDGNRAARKAIDRAHLGRACAQAQTVKLADLIDNTRSIVQYDPGFARVYMAEKRQLLALLTRGDGSLSQQAKTVLDAYFLHLSKV